MSHITAVITEINITTGTNMPLTLSTRRAASAFEFPASSTSLIIFARVVSFPTFNAFTFKYPFSTVEADITLSSFVFSTGILSPVTADSLICPVPSIIIPSTGIIFPALSTRISPALTSSAAISVSFPSCNTIAVFGAKSVSFFKASDVLSFERASRNFPRVTIVKIAAQDSK